MLLRKRMEPLNQILQCHIQTPPVISATGKKMSSVALCCKIGLFEIYSSLTKVNAHNISTMKHTTYITLKYYCGFVRHKHGGKPFWYFIHVIIMITTLYGIQTPYIQLLLHDCSPLSVH